MKVSLLSLLALSTAVSAWLPSERNFFGEQPNSVAHNLAAGKGRSVKRYLSAFNKIRGVNLGSLFIIEPWMASQEWAAMGCDGTNSEFDCMARLGQDAGNKAFAGHWDTWITEEDLDRMMDFGINTIRVPVGYWMVEETVYRDSEHFPQGGMAFLDRLVGWAANRGMYVILDLHGAPGAQEANQPFTGQYAGEPGFYQSYQFDRAYWFLQVMTDRIHQHTEYRTVGMIEVVNEPARNHPNLVSEYYATAHSKIRESETHLNIPAESALTIQFMDSAWGAGNAKDVVGDAPNIAYDDHRYLKWSDIEHTKESYLRTSCTDTFGRDGNSPVIVGEWSLAVKSEIENTPEWDPKNADNNQFYQQWWASQVQAYERDIGWVFWSWKSQLGADWRWSYRQAVEANVIPKDPNSAAGIAKC
ncbi:glycoside hydrolase family 5 protein [Melanomma pulvis-pyrius CBS 109.77]|uniref:glucan endo-1,6-beta-glucosidase n=1 Tax=Melanomma pulvis-pyrius CBS 109.77 TaxID=1314802 RepID=A0A6A6XJ38_9PLEO|nr:glycoside hydrolase family 5 protein [Melanomma pulvis-pyrius CBS 109.77]